MSQQLLAALREVDKLNSYVRSESFRQAWSFGSLRRHIYELKRRAIRRANDTIECTHRPLSILATCRGCSGTGKYTDSYGRDYPHCRGCANSGVVTLHFVESVIGPFRWHSPRLSFPLDSRRLGVETTAGDWNVNQPGKDLTTDELAGALIAADDYFRPEWWQMDCRCGAYGDDCYRHYEVYIGRSVASCAHCGKPGAPRDGNYSCRQRFARYTVRVCDSCRARLTTEQAFAAPVPAELLTPNVVEWMRRMDAIPMRRCA